MGYTTSSVMHQCCVITTGVKTNNTGRRVSDRPGGCAHASRAMTETEQNYTQIEKELLAIMLACEQFNDYIPRRCVGYTTSSVMHQCCVITTGVKTNNTGRRVSDRPGGCAHASRAMTETEQNYTQIEKELLAIMLACEQFNDYIYGQDIAHVGSDHKPLESVLKCEIHLAPKRLQRMRLRLQKYPLDVRVRNVCTLS